MNMEHWNRLDPNTEQGFVIYQAQLRYLHRKEARRVKANIAAKRALLAAVKESSAA